MSVRRRSRGLNRRERGKLRDADRDERDAVLRDLADSRREAIARVRAGADEACAEIEASHRAAVANVWAAWTSRREG